MKNNRNKKKTMIEMEKEFHQNNHGLLFLLTISWLTGRDRVCFE